MTSLKHVGRVKNTGRRCVIVFREIYDEKGHVIDENNCLVFESESLPSAEHQELMRIIESEAAQATGDLFNVLGRERLGNSSLALNWLVDTARLRKFPTDNVDLTPDAKTVIGLNTINKIVKMQKTGATEAEIASFLRKEADLSPAVAEDMSKDMVKPVTGKPDSSTTLQSGPNGVLNDATLATSYISQARVFEQRAKELRGQAKALIPTKTRTKRTTKKKPANKKA